MTGLASATIFKCMRWLLAWINLAFGFEEFPTKRTVNGMSKINTRCAFSPGSMIGEVA